MIKKFLALLSVFLLGVNAESQFSGILGQFSQSHKDLCIFINKYFLFVNYFTNKLIFRLLYFIL